MTLDPDEDLFTRALDAFGEQAQVIQTIQELNELSVALTKYYFDRDQYAVGRVAEEMVDVEIMLAQLRLIFLNDPLFQKQYARLKLFKRDRLEERIAAHYRNMYGVD